MEMDQMSIAGQSWYERISKNTEISKKKNTQKPPSINGRKIDACKSN